MRLPVYLHQLLRGRLRWAIMNSLKMDSTPSVSLACHGMATTCIQNDTKLVQNPGHSFEPYQNGNRP